MAAEGFDLSHLLLHLHSTPCKAPTTDVISTRHGIRTWDRRIMNQGFRCDCGTGRPRCEHFSPWFKLWIVLVVTVELEKSDWGGGGGGPGGGYIFKRWYRIYRDVIYPHNQHNLTPDHQSGCCLFYDSFFSGIFPILDFTHVELGLYFTHVNSSLSSWMFG